MGEKIFKTGIKRDIDLMYYIKGGDVWATPRKQPGQPKGKAQRVAVAGVEMDYSRYLYYLDGDGDIARKRREVGGSKRRPVHVRGADEHDEDETESEDEESEEDEDDETEEGNSLLIDDGVVPPQPVHNNMQPPMPAPPGQTDELPGRGPLLYEDGPPPQPVYSNVQPVMRVPPGQADELPGTTDAKASAEQESEGSTQHAPSSSDPSRLDWLPTLADPPRAAHRGQPGGETAPPSQFGLGAATSSSPGTTNAKAQPQASWAERTLLASQASDAPEGKDLLQLDREVDALASLLVAKNVEPPLSVGLFGEWGSGKSFFMKELHRAIEVKAASEAEDTFCRKVIQIRFNAWHYVDADLWSSLAAGVFDALSREFKSEFARACVAELASLQERQEEIKAEQRTLEARAGALDGELALQRQLRANRKLELADYVAGLSAEVVREVAASPRVAEIRKQLRLDGQAGRVELEHLRHDLATFEGRVRRWWQTLRSPARLAAVAASVAVPVLARAIWVAVGAAWGSTATATATSVLGVLAVIRQRAGRALGPSERLIDGALDDVDRIEAAARAKQSAEEQRVELERDQVSARVARLEREQLDLTRRRAELDAQLASLGDAANLKDFVLRRAASDDYRKRLGVISAVHQDFQQLAKFLAPGHEGPDVDRIVLYIDDLDRCGVDHIIAVLQAVHLLLAFRLFVVVVGVDPRRLIDSLEQHYRPPIGSEDSADRKTTPRGYLEKIFQIPFVLRPMGAKGFQNLVSELARPNAAPVPSPTPQPVVQGNEAPAATLAPATASPSQRKSAISLIEISDAESAFMQKLGALIPTPRAAKRFVNMYRLMRAISTDDIVAHDTWRLPMVLLALLIGEPDNAAALYQQIAQASDTSWLDFTRAHSSGAVTKLSSILNKEPVLMNARLADLQKWIPTVSRYSFQCSIPSFV
jgi:KAP-like P-loop domain-containing protein